MSIIYVDSAHIMISNHLSQHDLLWVLTLAFSSLVSIIREIVMYIYAKSQTLNFSSLRNVNQKPDGFVRVERPDSRSVNYKKNSLTSPPHD